MAKTPVPLTNNPQKSATSHALFPSPSRWEAGCESNLVLADIHAQAAKLGRLNALFSNKRFNELGLRTQRAALRFAVSGLGLGEAAASRLREDGQLISSWYLMPARRAYMQTDTASDRAALAAVAKAAEPFAAASFTDVKAAQDLIDAFPHGADSPVDDLDLLQLQYQLQVLVSATGGLLKRTSPGVGRAANWRRDQAIALFADAVCGAIGTAPNTSRGTNARPEAHFRNAAGRFVASVMALLGWRDEHVLVRVVEAQRRAKPVKQ